MGLRLTYTDSPSDPRALRPLRLIQHRIPRGRMGGSLDTDYAAGNASTDAITTAVRHDLTFSKRLDDREAETMTENRKGTQNDTTMQTDSITNE